MLSPTHPPTRALARRFARALRPRGSLPSLVRSLGACDNADKWGKAGAPQDPFGTYREWGEHRYDPGHYLGGTIQPHLRKSELGPRARRLSGAMLFLGGCAGLLMLLPGWRRGADDLSTGLAYLDAVLQCGLSSLAIVAGVAMYRSGPRRGSKRRTRD